MVQRHLLEQQLAHTLEGIDLPDLGEKIEGKVRDCYVRGDRRLLIASDRLSAFDVVLTTIPCKGQLLTELATFWFDKTKHIIPNHIIAHPHPNVMITREVEILPIEVIVRGYLTGSAWRDYEAGNAVSGITLPQGLRRSQQFAEPLITPSTKAARGEHDMPIASDEIVRSGLVERSLWEEVCRKALELFAFGAQEAEKRDLILVDTKYEFGVLRNASGERELILADEVHTPDSSRYWIKSSYEERFNAGEDPEMLDKEFVRRHLLAQGYKGEGTPPVLSDSFRVDTALRYIELFEKVTGQEFTPALGPVAESVAQALREWK